MDLSTASRIDGERMLRRAKYKTTGRFWYKTENVEFGGKEVSLVRTSTVRYFDENLDEWVTPWTPEKVAEMHRLERQERMAEEEEKRNNGPQYGKRVWLNDGKYSYEAEIMEDPSKKGDFMYLIDFSTVIRNPFRESGN